MHDVRGFRDFPRGALHGPGRGAQGVVAMHGPHTMQLGFHFFGQILVRGTRVAETGLPANVRNFQGLQQRDLGRLRKIGIVRMPARAPVEPQVRGLVFCFLIGAVEQRDFGHVVDPHVAQKLKLRLAEISGQPRERPGFQGLCPQTHEMHAQQRVPDGGNRGVVNRPGPINARHLGAQRTTQRHNLHSHSFASWIDPPRGQSNAR